MQLTKKIDQYSVFDINRIMDGLKDQYDIVRLVDVEECRVLNVSEDGMIHYGCNCFDIWGRKNRCANCTSKRACMTSRTADKVEHLGHDREAIHSIPVYLEQSNGETVMGVIECVGFAGAEGARYVETPPDEYVNSHDMLTRLYTQEMLLREIRRKLNEHPDERYLLIMGNIRNFSVINKLFGIDGGNRLLIHIADLLRSEYTDEEIYGRCRDDRFVLLIRKDKFDPEKMARHFASIRQQIDSPIFTVQFKAGIFEIPTRDMAVSSMIEHAQVAVDSIRDTLNTDVAWYAPGMMEEKVKEHRVVSHFEQALCGGEFQMYLQPQVREDGKIQGGEALVRWIRPDGTMTPPNDFLPALREAELLSSLDAYIWEQAVKRLSLWQNGPLHDMYISINVDPTDFYHIDVPAVLGELCRRYGIPPAKLRVEITESALFDDADHRNLMVDQLHEAGFIVEIDDFGKGFSSLSMLKDVRADVLKIDMGFVQGEENRQRGGVILTSVIDMADQLHMGVITEGVETQEQVQKLKAIGCHHFQGYYFSRPIPVDVFEMVALDSLKRHP